jgi:hypothetical protein
MIAAIRFDELLERPGHGEVVKAVSQADDSQGNSATREYGVSLHFFVQSSLTGAVLQPVNIVMVLVIQSACGDSKNPPTLCRKPGISSWLSYQMTVTPSSCIKTSVRA